MKKTLLSSVLMAGALLAQGQLQIGGMEHIDFSLSNNRGTDTVYSLGVINAADAGELAAYTTPGGGMLLGTSEYPVTDFAQQFELFGDGATIDELLFFFASGVYGSGNPASHIKARVYNMNGTGATSVGPGQAAPGTVAAEGEIPMSTVAANVTDQLDTYGMVGPVWVGSNFAAGFNIASVVAGDSINIVATTAGFIEFDDYSWIRLANNWVSLKAAIDGDGNIDMVIAAILTPSSVNVGEESWMNGMQMTILEGNPVQGQFTVQYNVRDNANMALRIFDATGRNVENRSIGTRMGINQEVVNTNGWTSGVYYVNMMANGRPITKKVVVE